ncbi:transposase [Paraburkholderia youngii]|uniref:transposase n=1 Tax=Paraburkholderia youngii TaxID=2782701 RepID=UPI0015928504|nr:transposase [Paraburkholderia youngii]NUX57622.1 IS110 family transposase [Paraburkholderia youngii]
MSFEEAKIRDLDIVLGSRTTRGVQLTTAVGMLTGFGDLSHFVHRRELMAWLRITRSEHSSEEKHRLRRITKNGNKLCTKAGCRSGLEQLHPTRVSLEMQRWLEGIPKPIVYRVWDAQVRLCRICGRLVAHGTQKNP